MGHRTQSDVGALGIGKRIGVAAGLALAAYLSGELLVVGIVLSIGDVLGPGGTLLVGILGLQLTIALVAVGFLRGVLDRPLVSIGRPTRDERRLVALSVVASVVLAGIYAFVVQVTSLESAGTVPVDTELGAGVLAVVFFLSVLLPPITEELLFRGVIQRYVRDVSSSAVGIIVATALFVPMHGAAVLGTASGVTAALGILGLLAGVSVIIGVGYARTNNLVVPILIHAGYNILNPFVMELVRTLPL